MAHRREMTPTRNSANVEFLDHGLQIARIQDSAAIPSNPCNPCNPWSNFSSGPAPRIPNSTFVPRGLKIPTSMPRRSLKTQASFIGCCRAASARFLTGNFRGLETFQLYSRLIPSVRSGLEIQFTMLRPFSRRTSAESLAFWSVVVLHRFRIASQSGAAAPHSKTPAKHYTFPEWKGGSSGVGCRIVSCLVAVSKPCVFSFGFRASRSGPKTLPITTRW
jgi:hypothetical protein